MKRILKITKTIFVLFVIWSMILPSYATISTSDGSAFVTKAEFDSALAEFNTRLTTFEAGINSKIDSQVTSYLDRNGIWSGKKQDLATTWNMTDYEWDSTGTTRTGPYTKTIDIGKGCSWGDIFGLPRSGGYWHLKWQDTTQHGQKESAFSSWATWESWYSSYYSTTNGFCSLLLAGANGTNSTTIGQVQWSPTLGNSLKSPNNLTGKKIEALTWRILPQVTKSGLLFLDFGQIADFDPYININSQWQTVNWDTGLRYDFSIVFRRYNKNDVAVEDPWEEHWGDVADSKIKGTKTMIVGGVVKRIGNDNLPYSISSAQINISHFRKSINFFVAKGDKIDAIVKTVGFNQATSFLGRWNWSYSPNAEQANMAIHGPIFEFYNATVY